MSPQYDMNSKLYYNTYVYIRPLSRHPILFRSVKEYYLMDKTMRQYLRDHEDADCSMFQDAVALDCERAPAGGASILRMN